MIINWKENRRYRSQIRHLRGGNGPRTQKAYRMSQLIFTHISDYEHVFVIKDTKVFTF